VSEQWTEWRPKWAPHVRGEHTPRVMDPETGLPESQKIRIVCERCGATWGPSECTSGLVRNKIAAYALDHKACLPVQTPKLGDG
jgi:hypothetical protein